MSYSEAELILLVFNTIAKNKNSFFPKVHLLCFFEVCPSGHTVFPTHLAKLLLGLLVQAENALNQGNEGFLTCALASAILDVIFWGTGGGQISSFTNLSSSGWVVLDSVLFASPRDFSEQQT